MIQHFPFYQENPFLFKIFPFPSRKFHFIISFSFLRRDFFLNLFFVSGSILFLSLIFVIILQLMFLITGVLATVHFVAPKFFTLRVHFLPPVFEQPYPPFASSLVIWAPRVESDVQFYISSWKKKNHSRMNFDFCHRQGAISWRTDCLLLLKGLFFIIVIQFTHLEVNFHIPKPLIWNSTKKTNAKAIFSHRIFQFSEFYNQGLHRLWTIARLSLDHQLPNSDKKTSY